MIYYMLIIGLAIILSMFTTEKNKKFMISIIVVLLTLLAGLRHYTIGNDTYNYMKNFNSIVYYGVNYLKLSRLELGYNYIVYLFTLTSHNFNAFLMFISLIMNLIIAKFVVNNSKNAIFSMILFILMRFFFVEMNIVRQFLAMCIFIYSYKYVESRKLGKFLLFIFIASSIHISSLFAIPIYFLYNLNLTSIKKILMIMITFAFSIFLYRILTYFTGILGVYYGYVDEFYGSNKVANIVSFIISFFIFLLCNYINRKYIKGEINETSISDIKKFDFYNNVSFITMLINFLTIRISILSRLTLYYEIFYILLIPSTISLIKNSKTRLFWYVLIFFCFLVYFLVITYLRPNWNMVNPYRFYWQ